MTTKTSPIRRHLRLLPPAALIAAAAALGGSAVGEPAKACAAPREWDIGTYDECIANGYGKGYDAQEWENHKALCCLASGGDWNAVRSECQAPPAEQAHAPWQAGVGEIPAYTLEPVAPPATRIPSGIKVQPVQGATS
jgi:hypothetical protein